MARVIQISEASNLAIHALGYLSHFRDGDLRSTAEIARVLRVSEAHLGKVLQRLAKFGLVSSTRGARGGFRLARDPGDVSLLEIIELLDGPITGEECLLGKPVCQHGKCILSGLLSAVHGLVRKHLQKTTLKQFALDPSLLDSDG